MNGPIAQFAALACHANARLKGYHLRESFESNSTCRFCDRIEFAADDCHESTLLREGAAAPTPDAWIDGLARDACVGVRLLTQARNDPQIGDRMSAGFAGGGRIWQMEVNREDRRSEIWSSDWQVWNPKAARQRIWRVRYRLERTEPSALRVGRTLPIVKAAFRESLAEARAFAERHTQGAFTQSFVEALHALDDPAAEIGHHKDIAPPGQLSDDAASLLRATMRAWVFGGMGSWNDIGFEEPVQTEYENVSERLFNVIHEAIEVAVNSTDPMG